MKATPNQAQGNDADQTRSNGRLRPSWRLWILSASGIAGGLLLCFVAALGYLREPEYKGKTVSAWLREVSPGQPGAAEPYLAIGHKAVPVLVAALDARASRGLKWLEALWNHLQPARQVLLPGDLMNRAFWAIEVLGTEAKDAASAVIRQVRLNGVGYIALGRITPKDPAVVAVLHAVLTPAPSEQEQRLREALAEVRPETRPSIDALLEVLVATNGPVIWSTAAFKSLQQSPAWSGYTNRVITYRQTCAVLALACIAPDPDALRPILAAYFEDASPNKRLVILSCAARMGSAGVPLLLAGLRDSNALVRLNAARFPFVPTPADYELSRALIQALADPSDQVARAAMSALPARPPAGRSAIEELTALLDYRDPAVKQRACDCLRSLGPAAIAAAPKLRQLIDEPTEYSWLTRSASNALTAVTATASRPPPESQPR